jgi:multidrug transporter EmrE-like cation transporter
MPLDARAQHIHDGLKGEAHMLAGITIFRERPASYQLFGVLLVLSGLFLLAIKPA